MAFKDLDEFFDDTLPLPVGNKYYKIPSPPAEIGLWCQRVLVAGIEIASGEQAGAVPEMPTILGDDEEKDLYRKLLGPVWQELWDDGVSWEKIKHIGQTAFIWVGGSREMAEVFWNSGGDPKAPAPNRAARRQPASTGTGAAGTTKPASSTSTTRSRTTGTVKPVSRRSPGK